MNFPIHSFTHSLTRLYEHRVFCVLVVALAWIGASATVDYSLGDNRLNLLTTQSILQEGTVKLDAVFERCGEDSILKGDRSAYFESKGHRYNYFPLGTPTIALPVVALANVAGFDMAVRNDMQAVQRFCSVAILLILFAITYQIARLYLQLGLSALLGFVFILGSQASSTMMVGLWSHNVTTICLGFLVLHLLSLNRNGIRVLHGSVFGLLCFLAYFSRPSAAVWIFVLLVWLFVVDFRALRWALTTLSIGFICFILWSFSEFGVWLPKYYLPNRISGAEGQADFLAALSGNLFSPSRGLLTYVPVVSFALSTPLFIKGNRMPMYALLIGIVLHCLMISLFPHWWGGWSFGPRLQTESLPALFALFVIAFWYAQFAFPRFYRTAFNTLFILLSIFGLFVNTIQGAFQPETRKWNGVIDLSPEHYLWNWEFPQFLAGFYPNGIVEKKAVYADRLVELLKDVPQKAAYFMPAWEERTPYLRRITRGFNSRRDFGDIHLFNDWEARPKDRIIYSGYDGLLRLKSINAPFSFKAVKQYSNLAETARAHQPKHVFVVSNCFEPQFLDVKSKLFLREIKSGIVDSSGKFGLLQLIEDGGLRWEMFSRNGKLKKDWYHRNYAFFLSAAAGNCAVTPKAKFQKRPLQSQGFQSYIFVLDDNSGEMETIPMIFQGVDMRADATFILQPLD